jgi:hypothetical protein
MHEEAKISDHLHHEGKRLNVPFNLFILFTFLINFLVDIVKPGSTIYWNHYMYD